MVAEVDQSGSQVSEVSSAFCALDARSTSRGLFSDVVAFPGFTVVKW